MLSTYMRSAAGIHPAVEDPWGDWERSELDDRLCQGWPDQGQPPVILSSLNFNLVVHPAPILEVNHGKD